MRSGVAALVLSGVALLAPSAATWAAWSDTSLSSAPSAMTAAAVPEPVLTCARSGLDVVVSWPAAALPGDGVPEVGYTARVVESGQSLTVSGGSTRQVTVRVGSLTDVVLGAARTVAVTATATFGATSWTAVSERRVRVDLFGLVLGLTCV